MEVIEDHICQVFYRVLKDLTDDLSPCDVKSMKQYLPEMRRKYKGREARQSTVHSFPSASEGISKTSVLRSSYSYECGVCLSSAVARTLLDLRTCNPDFFERKGSRKTINICCLAGSLGSKAVAAVEVFNKVHEADNGNFRFTNFCVTFVNKDDTWKSVFDAVMAELREHVVEKFKAKITPKFLAYGDVNNIPRDVLEVFQGADVFLATKLSQEWCQMPDKEFKHLLMEALQNMKPDSLLYFADFSSADFLCALEADVNRVGSVRTVFKETNVFHSVSLDTIAKHFECYRDYLGNDLNCSYCVLSVVAWQKFDRKHELEKGAPKGEKANSKKAVKKNLDSWTKNVEKMQKNQRSFPLKKSAGSLSGQNTASSSGGQNAAAETTADLKNGPPDDSEDRAVSDSAGNNPWTLVTRRKGAASESKTPANKSWPKRGALSLYNGFLRNSVTTRNRSWSHQQPRERGVPMSMFLNHSTAKGNTTKNKTAWNTKGISGKISAKERPEKIRSDSVAVKACQNTAGGPPERKLSHDSSSEKNTNEMENPKMSDESVSFRRKVKMAFDGKNKVGIENWPELPCKSPEPPGKLQNFDWNEDCTSESSCSGFSTKTARIRNIPSQPQTDNNPTSSALATARILRERVKLRLAVGVDKEENSEKPRSNENTENNKRRKNRKENEKQRVAKDKS